MKGTVTNVSHAAWDCYRCQPTASTEGTFTDGSHRVWYRDRCQPTASFKGIVTKGSHRLWNDQPSNQINTTFVLCMWNRANVVNGAGWARTTRDRTASVCTEVVECTFCTFSAIVFARATGSLRRPFRVAVCCCNFFIFVALSFQSPFSFLLLRHWNGKRQHKFHSRLRRGGTDGGSQYGR